MISAETRAQIRHWFFAEHWKIGTIAQELSIHPDTVRHAIESDRFHRAHTLRACLTDPYLPFIRQTLDQHPRLRATRIYQMIRERGYHGSVIQLRRAVATLRPSRPEPFLRLHTFPAEQAQVDWAHFGEVQVGRARRRLSCFLITLSYSRALYLEFFFDQTLENFLRGHVHAFEAWSGQPRVILHDNLRSAVLERRGDQVHFHPRLLELCAHYHCLPRPCQVRAGNQKGRVERAIRYVRESFWAGRAFTTLPECNRQALLWRDEVAHQRPWPGDDTRTVAVAFAEEQPRLLPLPVHPFPTDLILPIRSQKTTYIRFDLNDYSIPPEALGRPLLCWPLIPWSASWMELRKSRATPAAMTGISRCSIHPIKTRYSNSSARRSTPPPAAAWPKRHRKAKPCWSWPSPEENPPARRPLNCSNCWTSTAQPPCEAPSVRHSNATPRALLRLPFCFVNDISEHPPPHLWWWTSVVIRRRNPSIFNRTIWRLTMNSPVMAKDSDE